MGLRGFRGFRLSFGVQKDLSSVSSGLYIIKPYTPNPGSQIYQTCSDVFIIRIFFITVVMMIYVTTIITSMIEP